MRARWLGHLDASTRSEHEIGKKALKCAIVGEYEKALDDIERSLVTGRVEWR